MHDRGDMSDTDDRGDMDDKGDMGDRADRRVIGLILHTVENGITD